MRWFSRHRDERGVVAVVMAIVICFVMIPIAGLAVDIGVQRVARRDMQSVADQAALDLGREMGAGQTPTVTDALNSAAESGNIVGGVQNVTYNSNQVSVPKMAVYTGYIAPGATFVSDQSLGCNGSAYNSYFVPATLSNPANAVLVTATGSVRFHLVPGSGGVCRSAIGTAALVACMTMDSYAAALSSGNSAILGPLNSILPGTGIDTTLLGSSGILTTDLDVLSFLGILKTQLGVGGIDDVLAAHVSAAQIIVAEVAALNAQGASAAATVLQSQIGVRVPAGTQVVVGDLLDVTQGGNAGLAASVNPLDLAAAAVQLANGTSAVQLAASGQNLTGLALSASIISHPTPVCLGEGTKTMAQGSVTATANINAPGTLTSAVTGLVNSLGSLLSGVLNGLGGLLGADTYDTPVVTLGTLSASVSLASATGKVTNLSCPSGHPTSMAVQEGSSLVPATVTIPLTVKETRHYGSILARKSETVTSTLLLTFTTSPSADQSVAATFAIPDDLGKSKAGPSGNLSVGNTSLTTTLTTDGSFSNGNALVNTMLAGLVKVTSSIQTSLLSPLLSTVVTPLLNTVTTAVQAQLGLTLAGSTYTPTTAKCNSPKLDG
ncbi:MAG TPA: pilus assembly protein TadG-related protein [Marmoricola sp.]|nr:pilus assembly protein TadG-related protein [Marmoricola sp.]